MKAFIALIMIISTIAFVGGVRLKRLKFSERNIIECEEETKLDPESADKLILGDLKIRSEEAKCFISCFFKKSGFLDEDGEPQKQRMADALLDTVNITIETLNQIVEKCTEVRTADKCVNAVEIYKCLIAKTASKSEL